MLSPARLLALVLLWPLLVAAVGCGGAQLGGAAASHIPSDAEEILYVPALGQLGQGILGFSGGLDGGAGLTELLAERYGFDVRTPEGLDRVGLDARGDLALFRASGCWVLGVSSHRPERLMEHAGQQLLRSFGARPAAVSRALPRLYTLPEGSEAGVTGVIAGGVTADGVGLFVLTGLDAEAGAAKTL